MAPKRGRGAKKTQPRGTSVVTTYSLRKKKLKKTFKGKRLN